VKEIGSMTAEDVVSDAVLEEVFSDEDEIHKARLLLTLEDHAAALGVKTRFGKMVAAYRRVEKQIRKAEKDRPARSLDNWTGFEGPYDNMYCGSWIAREDGIYVQNTGTVDVVGGFPPPPAFRGRCLQAPFLILVQFFVGELPAGAATAQDFLLGLGFGQETGQTIGDLLVMGDEQTDHSGHREDEGGEVQDQFCDFHEKTSHTQLHTFLCVWYYFT